MDVSEQPEVRCHNDFERTETEVQINTITKQWVKRTRCWMESSQPITQIHAQECDCATCGRGGMGKARRTLLRM
jgi:hypothetical protein